MYLYVYLFLCSTCRECMGHRRCRSGCLWFCVCLCAVCSCCCCCCLWFCGCVTPLSAAPLAQRQRLLVAKTQMPHFFLPYTCTQDTHISVSAAELTSSRSSSVKVARALPSLPDNHVVLWFCLQHLKTEPLSDLL